ncbi:MAG: hypothetical protein O9327_21395 [Polaromonas sp.]|nr:hypothetical protein [Polaromonas sp.]
MIIGVEGLSAAEVGLLRTILKLSTQLAVEWTLSEEGPCDVLLTVNATVAGQAPVGHFVVPIVRRGGGQGGECLERPFRAEDFVALLGRVGPTVVKVAASDERQGEAITPPTARRGCLKRWPPAQLMGTSRERIQLATMLSRRPRSARELSAMAGYPESACGAFMQELDQHNLLSWEIHDQAQAATTAAPPIHTPVPAGRGARSPGLLSSIRRRLGLSRNSRSA